MGKWKLYCFIETSQTTELKQSPIGTPYTAFSQLYVYVGIESVFIQIKSTDFICNIELFDGTCETGGGIIVNVFVAQDYMVQIHDGSEVIFAI